MADMKKPPGLAAGRFFQVLGDRLLAGSSRSGVSSGRSRSGHGSSFFLLAASGQSNSSHHTSQQDRLVHTCPQNSLNEIAITGNFLKPLTVAFAFQRHGIGNFGMTRRGKPRA